MVECYQRYLMAHLANTLHLSDTLAQWDISLQLEKIARKFVYL